ncbi:MAG: hypothetical protein GWM87_13250 [Xanthomonadales bacterium]|nr:hypothetical protein [Xanthomonadales bacterium]NIX13788.1 hypothetical protein [Xanthomonadales bacterium]
MTLVIAVFGVLIAGLSAWGLLVPRRMLDTVLEYWRKPYGLHLAIGIRLALGLLFILAAPDTGFPLFFQVFGYLMLIAAALIPVIGKPRLTRVIDWFTGMPVLAIRTWLVLMLLFAGFIVYAAVA